MGAKDEQILGRGKPKPKYSGRGRQGPDSEFINRELTLEETAAYRKWREDAENVAILWTETLDDGYKLSQKYDDYSSSYATFLFPPAGSDNEGYIVAGRGGTAYRSLAEVLYKHYELFGKSWSAGGPRGSAGDDPDW